MNTTRNVIAATIVALAGVAATPFGSADFVGLVILPGDQGSENASDGDGDFCVTVINHTGSAQEIHVDGVALEVGSASLTLEDGQTGLFRLESEVATVWYDMGGEGKEFPTPTAECEPN